MAPHSCAILGFVLMLLVAGRTAAPRPSDPADGAPAEPPGRHAYVVAFKPGVGAEYARAVCAEAEARGAGRFSGACQRQFTAGLVGLAGTFTPADLEALLDAYGEVVEYVERDGSMRITGTAAPDWAASDDGVPREAHSEDRDLRLHALEAQREELRRRMMPEQDDPGWNLDRIDQQGQALDHKYHYAATGVGVNVYVLDTGIRATHQEFRLPGGGWRVQQGFSAFADGETGDCNGHGTHTAATIGGLTYGVAKNVTLWPVRAVDCDGSSTVSRILTALEWVADNARPPAVLSMSVAGELSLAVNEAVRQLVESHGITVVVAAGNGYTAACEVSPGSSPSAITVGASDQFDRRWARSNWGPCVDMHAPGVDVLSATNASSSGSVQKTGTSMACPHISGVVALYLEQHPGASPLEVRTKLNSAALSGVLRDDVEGYGTFDPEDNPQALDVTSTPNRLVYALLPSQAVFSPGTLEAGPGQQPATLQFRLDHRPSQVVHVSASTPLAGWANTPLATLRPRSFTISPDAWDHSQQLTLTPSIIANGDYHLTFIFTSQDSGFGGAAQGVKVLDRRPLTGDTLQDPRAIAALPFVDVEDSSRFTDHYSLDNSSTSPRSSAPDVVYKFRVATTFDVDISTCGSTFDTKLFLLDDPTNLQAYVTNDDDPQCASNPRNSRISTRLQASRTYYILVDGYSGSWISAQGQYRLTVAERVGPPVGAAVAA